LDRWWPLSPGARAEVGTARDVAWADAVARVRAGAALAVDYGHLRADRVAGRYWNGTLTGYQSGRQVAPVPDGNRDLTAHVAMDACAAAAPASDTVLVTQRDVLAALGLAKDSPPAAQAAADPHAWLAAYARAGRIAELRAPEGLGAFGWLLQTTGGLPASALLPTLPPWTPPPPPSHRVLYS
jgi:SAM-dependent MidA family methyltransferase